MTACLPSPPLLRSQFRYYREALSAFKIAAKLDRVTPPLILAILDRFCLTVLYLLPVFCHTASRPPGGGGVRARPSSSIHRVQCLQNGEGSRVATPKRVEFEVPLAGPGSGFAVRTPFQRQRLIAEGFTHDPRNIVLELFIVKCLRN